MSHPLLILVRRVRGKARIVQWVRAWSLFLAMTLGVLAAAALFDFAARGERLGGRCALSAGVLAVVCFVWVRKVLPVFRARPDDLAIARRMEGVIPEWGDRLSSAVAFLNVPSTDIACGSPRLRQSHIESVLREAGSLGDRRILRWSRASRPLAILAVTTLLMAGLGAHRPDAAWLAAQRLALPWRELDWPRRQQLAFVDPPSRIAFGQDFRAVVIDANHRLPSSVVLSIWHDGDKESAVVRDPMRRVDDRMECVVMNIARSFRYRAEGGDDRAMPWRRVDVVPPPELASIEVRVVPPAYSGLPPVLSNGPIRALEGSAVTVRGSLSRGVDTIRWRSDPVDVAVREDRTPIARGVPGSTAVWQWPGEGSGAAIVARAGRYWWELASDDGVTASTSPWNVVVFPDRPPDVTTTSRGARTGTVTQRAVLTIDARAADDLALRDAVLVVRGLSGDFAEREIVLFRADAPRVAVDPDGTTRADERALACELPIESLGVEPGQIVEWIIRVSDFKSQTNETEPARVAVVAPDDLEDGIERRLAEFLPELERAIAAQRESRDAVGAVDRASRAEATATAKGRDQLRSAEWNQRDVARRIASDSDGLLGRTAALRRELDRNQLDGSSLYRRIAGIESAMENLARSTLPVIERRLASALEAYPDPDRNAPPNEDLAASLAATSEAQDVAIAEFDRLASQWSEWEGYRRFAERAEALRRDQETLLAETARLRRQSIARGVDDLTDSEREELRRLSGRQWELGNRFDAVRADMRAGRDRMATSDPTAAGTLDEALRIADSASPVMAMRDGAENLESNRLGRALENQRRAADALASIAHALARSAAGPEGAPAGDFRSAGDASLAELDARLDPCVVEERALIDATGALDASRRSDESWTQEQSDSLRALAARQSTLADRIAALAEPFGDSPVLEFALRSSVDAMRAAGSGLERLDAGPATQLAERRALARLEQWTRARDLEWKASSGAAPRPDNPMGDVEPIPPPAARGPSKRELLLIQVLQVDLAERTEELDGRWSHARRLGDPRAEAALQSEFELLANEQSALADLLARLTAAPSKNAPE
ncbi:MAG: DUF4175 domain-containing protein [Planctomycetes bacterium]|nr:DUF4175 domain-containing protein [Planctomycetota bacterium]